MTLGDAKRKTLKILDEYSLRGSISADADLMLKMNDFFDTAHALRRGCAGEQPAGRSEAWGVSPRAGASPDGSWRAAAGSSFATAQKWRIGL